MSQPIAYTVPAAAEAVGLSESLIRTAIRNGDLTAKAGGAGGSKILIGHDELQDWFDALPTYVPQSRAAS
jgi:hypothetical protein